MSHRSILFLPIVLSVFIFTNLLLDTIYILDRHLPPSCTCHISMWNIHLWYSVSVIDRIAVHTHALIPNHIFMASASKLPVLGRGTVSSFTQCFPLLRITTCCNRVASCRWLADQGDSLKWQHLPPWGNFSNANLYFLILYFLFYLFSLFFFLLYTIILKYFSSLIFTFYAACSMLLCYIIYMHIHINYSEQTGLVDEGRKVNVLYLN